jgi:hypothetical protein
MPFTRRVYIIMSLKKIFQEGLTNDKDEAEVILYAILVSLLVGLGLSMFDVIGHAAKFEFTSFGMGVGSILSLGGAGYAAKRFGDKANSPSEGTTTTEVTSVQSASTTSVPPS